VSPAVRVHDLRHTAASLWLAAGADPKVVTRTGYGIVPECRGRGLATEAAAAVVECNGVNFYSSARPPNPASVRVLEKIGMRLVDSYFGYDGQRDIYRR
jgi:predicted acetyltransferase